VRRTTTSPWLITWRATGQQLLDAVRAGEVDYITESVVMAVRLIDDTDAEPLLVRWKGGVQTYHSLFVSAVDSGIKELEDLIGRTVAFESANSSSAFVIPAVKLLEHGLLLERVPTPASQVKAGHVGVYFSGGERATAELLQLEALQAGAVSNLDWVNPDVFTLRHKRKLRVLYRSRNYPRGIELVRAGLPAAVKYDIKQRLLMIHRIPGAERVLDSYNNSRRFSAVDMGTLGSLESTRQLIVSSHGLPKE